jgi:predicted TIM-barrel fold metal-dependent hydrolase
LPLTDLYRDGLSPWEECAELASRDPDRTVFWGSVNPLEGRRALDLMERQVKEFGAKALKFYNVRYDYGQPFPWRMDDPRIAFLTVQGVVEARRVLIALLGAAGMASDRPVVSTMSVTAHWEWPPAALLVA